MITLIKSLLVLHAIAGGISLISGLFAIFSKKGQKLHIKSGLIYYWNMMIVVITGLIVGAYKGNIFISTIAVFSFYMVFTGRRILGTKKQIDPKFIDWFFNLLSLLISLCMISLGTYLFAKVGFAGVVPMLWVFGGLLFWMVLEDLMMMKKRNFKKGNWLLKHIGRMGGSYIATTTAFLVVNIDFQPNWIIWLLPTVVGTPILISTSNKWRNKMGLKKANAS